MSTACKVLSPADVQFKLLKGVPTSANGMLLHTTLNSGIVTLAPFFWANHASGAPRPARQVSWRRYSNKVRVLPAI